MLRTALVALVTLLLAAGPAFAKEGDHGGPGGGGDEVRVDGTCGAGATARLRLKARDGGIEVRFEVEQRWARVVWSVKLVQERRVVWRTAVKTTPSSRSFELRRTLPDLPGSDDITAQAWGPRGLTCRATATLAAD